MKLPKFFIRRVVGHSMEPTLKEGQLVVFRHQTFAINSIVLAKHSGKEIVKRIVRIENKGNKIWLEGDKASLAHNAVVDRDQIMGVLLLPRVAS